MTRKYNFSAGPATLPKEVLETAQAEMLDWQGSGMSVLEMSHRGKEYTSIATTAEANLRDLMSIPDNYKVLFLQGGASSQFAAIPLNLLGGNDSADYVNTGIWSKKAIAEASRYCSINVVATAETTDFTSIPPYEGWDINPDAAYLHYTPNETIGGLEFSFVPETNDIPLVADMSSNILSRPIDVSKYGMIYAGAQKNMGPAGATLVVVKEDILGKTGKDIPSMLDYQVHISKDSMFNTPSVFAVYVSMLTLQWLKDLGGVGAIEKINNAKAELLYNEIDTNPLFKGVAEKEDRSHMNVTFTLTNESLKNKFDEAWKAIGVNGLNGHRSVGGYRASIYNAMPLKSVQVLIDVMRELNN